MKKYIFPFLFLFLLAGCYEDQTVDITVMPEETTVGANTFGCLIDGWVYVGGRYHINSPISFDFNPKNKTMRVVVWIKPYSNLYFIIQNPEEGKQMTFTDAGWDFGQLRDGTVTITRFDTEKQIISGRFEGGRIEHGRFDVQYKVNNREEPFDY